MPRAERARPGRLMAAIGSLPKRSKPILALAGVILIAGIGGIDYLTGYEMAFSLFYLLPIAFVTWFVGRGMGVAVSVLSAAAWLLADAEAGHLYSHPAILSWNGVLRLGFFLTVTLLLAALQKSLLHERELSRLDSLTGAINSRYFMEVMQVEIGRSRRYGRPFTLVYLDIDDFKQVNDRFGHNSGDNVLRAVAAIIRSQRLFKEHFQSFADQYEAKHAIIYGRSRIERITEVVEKFVLCGDYSQGVAPASNAPIPIAGTNTSARSAVSRSISARPARRNGPFCSRSM